MTSASACRRGTKRQRTPDRDEPSHAASRQRSPSHAAKLPSSVDIGANGAGAQAVAASAVMRASCCDARMVAAPSQPHHATAAQAARAHGTKPFSTSVAAQTHHKAASHPARQQNGRSAPFSTLECAQPCVSSPSAPPASAPDLQTAAHHATAADHDQTQPERACREDVPSPPTHRTLLGASVSASPCNAARSHLRAAGSQHQAPRSSNSRGEASATTLGGAAAEADAAGATCAQAHAPSPRHGLDVEAAQAQQQCVPATPY